MKSPYRPIKYNGIKLVAMSDQDKTCLDCYWKQGKEIGCYAPEGFPSCFNKIFILKP